MTDWQKIGEIIAQQTQRVTMDKAVLWEDVLRLHIKPKPAWMPMSVWAKLLDMVLIQSVQRGGK